MSNVRQPSKFRGGTRQPEIKPASRPFAAWRTHGLRIGALWVVIFAAYSNSFSAGFVFDNRPVILQDARVQAATAHNIDLILTKGYWPDRKHSGLYRPLTTLSFLLNYAVFGDGPNPEGYHWFNFIIHGLNVTLVYALGISVFGGIAPAWLLAGIWGLHPLLTESVTNIVGRADLLAAFGVLAGLLCYMKGRSAEGGRKLAWLGGLLAAQALGLFSKENAAALIGLMLLYDLTWPERTNISKRAPFYGIAAVVFGAFAIFRAQSHPQMEVFFNDNPMLRAGFWNARITAVKVVGKYLWLFLWPVDLSPDYSFNAIPVFSWRLADWEDAKALCATVVCMAGILVAVHWRRAQRQLFFFPMFFFIALLPTSNMVILIGSVMAERFVYLPSIGLAGWLSHFTPEMFFIQRSRTE